jgi:phage repressor protein C with HTH and peptisase S24 domain
MKLPVFLQKLSKRRLYIRQIQGDSMLPLFKPGHLLLAVHDERAPREGDVVLIHHGGLEKVKRLKQIQGDRMYVEGDNQARSTDSRTFGWLHRSAIRARVIWPLKNRR